MMKKYFKKIFVFAAYSSLVFINACIGIDCDCPTDTPLYFDYFKLKIPADETVINATNAKLELAIIPDSIDFIAFQEAGSSFNFDLGLINKAYGCSCVEPGDSGDKYPISSINIYCDKDFNDTSLVGENINHLFEMLIDNGTGAELLALDEVSDFPTLYYYNEGLKLSTTNIPDSIGSNWQYTFTIELVKENGETVSGETEAISWY